MAPATSFARCTRCFSLCGVMREKDARGGGWLNVLDHTCECGASPEDLVTASEDEIQSIVAGIVMPLLVVVPDDWRGR
jgi:hypothetical protein